jgi:hypothetical protein
MGSSICTTLVEVCCFSLPFLLLEIEGMSVFLQAEDDFYDIFHHSTSGWGAWEAFCVNEEVRERA